MFGWEYPPFNSGGLGVACAGLARALVREGAEVSFVLPKKIPLSDKDGIHFIFANVQSANIGNAYSGQSIIDDDGVHHAFYGSGLLNEVLQYRLAAKRIAKKTAFDIIHAHDWLSFGAGIAAKEATGKPLVVHVHATQFDITGGNVSTESPIYKLEKEAFEKADKIVAVSKYTKDVIVANYGIDAEKIEVVHNGVEWHEKPATSESLNLAAYKNLGYKIVLYYGRITLQKGVDYFIHAAERVLAHNPRVLFLVVGSGDMQGQLMQDVSYKGLSDKIIFTGFLRGADLQCVLSEADLYVMPSVSEPFGLAPLEALLSGTPALISKQSGVKEVLTHALKVDFWDTDEMSNKIMAVLEHSSLSATLTDYGGKEARKQTWKKAAEKCMDIYTQLLTSKKFV